VSRRVPSPSWSDQSTAMSSRCDRKIKPVALRQNQTAADTTVIALALDRRNVHNFSNGLCIDPVVLPVRADKPDIGFKTLVEHDGEIRHLAGYHDCGLRRSRDQAQSD
jgi:hypothetical protein